MVGLFERGEALGYDVAYLPETWGRDAVTTLALAAERTSDVGLGSSIVNVYSRSPALVGQTAATLQEAADGRFRLGLGPSGPAVVENWHALMFTPGGLRERLDDLRRGAELGDRDPDAVRTTLSLPCCVLPDGERARHLVGQHVAFYVGGMGGFYRDSLARQGYEGLADAVRSAWRDGDRDAAIRRVEADLLDDVAVAGTPDRAREILSTFEAIDGLDAVAVPFPRGADREATDATMNALAPDAVGV